MLNLVYQDTMNETIDEQSRPSAMPTSERSYQDTMNETIDEQLSERMKNCFDPVGFLPNTIEHKWIVLTYVTLILRSFWPGT
ncbi:hypothetical protein [Trichothermofontia sp.]